MGIFGGTTVCPLQSALWPAKIHICPTCKIYSYSPNIPKSLIPLQGSCKAGLRSLELILRVFREWWWALGTEVEARWQEKNPPPDLWPILCPQPLGTEPSTLQVPLGWREHYSNDGPLCDAVAVSAAAAERTRQWPHHLLDLTGWWWVQAGGCWGGGPAVGTTQEQDQHELWQAQPGLAVLLW